MSAPAPAREIDDQLTNDAELELRHGAPFVQRPSWTAKLVALCAIGAIGLVVVAPIVFMLTQSFNRAGLGKPFVFGLDAWQTMLDSERTLKSLGYTLLLSLRVPIAVVLGAGIAWFLARTEIRLKRWVEYSLWLAFFMPTLPIVLGWIVLADPRTGLVNNTLSYLPGGVSLNIFSLQGIFWIHIMLTTVPVMTIFLSPSLRQMDVTLEESAQMSGAGSIQTLRHISLPLVKVALLAAGVIGFIRSLEVFEVERVLGTPAGVDVYATRIYDQIAADPPLFPEAMALGSLLLFTLLLLAGISQFLTRRWGDFATVGGRGVRMKSARSKLRDRVLMGAIVVFIGVGLYLPLAIVLLGSIRWRFGFFDIGYWTTEHWGETLADPAFLESLKNSAVVAFGAATIGLVCYAAIAWVIVSKRIPFTGALTLICWLPWAVPGILLGFAWSSIILGTGLSGVVYGTLIPLLGVLIVKELPLGVQMLRTAMAQVSSELEESAVMAGANPQVVLRRILLPLVVPMLATVFVFTFMMALRDISATVMLATPGTRTLSVLLFEYTVAGSYETAAVIGLLMAGLASLVALVALRTMRKHGLSGI